MPNPIIGTMLSRYEIPLGLRHTNGCKPNGLQFWMMQHFLPSEANLRLAFIAYFVGKILFGKIYGQEMHIPSGMYRLVEKRSSQPICIPIGMQPIINQSNN
jgi:hypothetical protein